LTTILGTLGEIAPASDVQAEQLAAARTEAERLNRFVANLLDMVRIEAGALDQSLEPVDLVDAVGAAVHDLRRILPGHKLHIRIPPDLPFVIVDPQLFHHCLINLIENAAKYGLPEGAIEIVAHRRHDALSLHIVDEGPGLPGDDLARVFETFTRIEGSDRKGGTGLGLAIVKGLAEAMGLTVSAANREDGKGARFTIHFPSDRIRAGDMAA